MSGFRDLGCLSLGAVIAPKVVLAQRLHVLIYWNDGRARGIESNRLHLLARNAGLIYCLAGRSGKSAHVIFMRLSRELGVFTLAM